MSTSSEQPALHPPSPSVDATNPPAPVAVRRVGRLRRLLRLLMWPRRHPTMVALILALAAIIVGSAILLPRLARLQREAEAATQENRQETEAAAEQENKQVHTYSRLTLANNAWRDGDTRAALVELNRCPPETWGWEYHYLRRQCLASSFTLRGHLNDVNSVCFGSDGGKLASGSDDGTVRVWDAATGLESRRFRLNSARADDLFRKSGPHPITCVCYSPDGQFLAGTSKGGEVRLTNDVEGGKTTELGSHEGAAWCAAFSPDGKRLASGGDDKLVRIWEIPNHKELPSLAGHSAAIRSVCFSPDGLRLASGDDNGAIRLWDARAGRTIRSLDGHKESVNEVCFSPDGLRLASAGADRTVRLWHISSGRPYLTLRGHTASVLCVRFSPDGLRLASGGADQVVRLWDARTGRQLTSFRGHEFGVGGVSFRPDGQLLASAGWDGTVRLWDCRTFEDGIVLEGLAGNINHACFTPDRLKVVGACADKMVRIWEAETGRLLHTLKGHSKEVLRVCVSADGKRLASTADHEINVWDALTGSLEIGTSEKKLRNNHWVLGLGISFTPDGEGVVTGSDIHGLSTSSVFVFDIRSGLLERKYRGSGFVGVYSAALSPDRRSLAVGDGSGVVVLEGISDNPKQIAVLNGPYLAPIALSFSVDGRCLAAGYRSGEVVVWDVANNPDPVQGKILEGHTAGVNGMDFSPDGRRLATAGADKTVRLWDTQLGRQALVLSGHTDSVLSVCFSADGQRLTSVGRDGFLRRWDASVSLPVLTWTDRREVISSLCFSPDEQLLASGTAAGHVQISEVPTFRPVGTIRVGDPFSKTINIIDTDGGGTVGRVKKVFFSPDGGRLATICGNNLELWDVRTREKVLTVSADEKQSKEIKDACFSPDGTRVAGGTGHGIIIWDSVKGNIVQQFGEESSETVCFSPDGGVLITSVNPSGYQRAIPVSFWDTSTGKLIRRQILNPGPRRCLCLSPDGNHFATDGYDENHTNVKIWRAGTGELEHSLLGHKANVGSIGYAPDCKWLLSCDELGEIRMWDTQTGKPRPLPTSFFPARGGRSVAISPSGRWLAYGGPLAGGVTLIDIPLAEAEKRRHQEQCRPDLAWHEREARAAAENHLWFAALFHVRHVVQARPEDADARLLLGTVLAEMSRWDEAVQDFNHIVQKAPDRAGVWRDLALAQHAAGQTDAARRTCRRLLDQKHPKDSYAVARCAVVLADGIADAKQLKPFLSLDDPVVRGAVLFRCGKTEEAVDALKNSDDEVGILFLALAECARGKPVEARKALQQVRQSLIDAAADLPALRSAMAWQKRIEISLLLQEAEASLLARKP